MSQRWQALGNTVFDLTGTRFELQTLRSEEECVDQLAGPAKIQKNLRARIKKYDDDL